MIFDNNRPPPLETSSVPDAAHQDLQGTLTQSDTSAQDNPKDPQQQDPPGTRIQQEPPKKVSPLNKPPDTHPNTLSNKQSKPSPKQNKMTLKQINNSNITKYHPIKIFKNHLTP